MSHVLLEILQSNSLPPHVHIGILLAATVPSTASEDAATTLAYVDLTSPTPHVRQFVQYAGDAEHDEALATSKSDRYRTAAITTTNNNNNANNSNGLEASDLAAGGLGGLIDTMALVPTDSLHMPNIHAAIRSLVDYDPSQLATTQTRDYTMSMPLGTSIETILDFMDYQQATDAMQEALDTDGDGSSNDNMFDIVSLSLPRAVEILATNPVDAPSFHFLPSPKSMHYIQKYLENDDNDNSNDSGNDEK